MDDTALLAEIRDLLLIIAEPQIAARDKRLRSELVELVGKGKKAQAAVLLMDGSRTQKVISDEAAIDPAQLSRVVKSLKARSLLSEKVANPKIVIPLPANFFDATQEA